MFASIKMKCAFLIYMFEENDALFQTGYWDYAMTANMLENNNCWGCYFTFPMGNFEVLCLFYTIKLMYILYNFLTEMVIYSNTYTYLLSYAKNIHHLCIMYKRQKQQQAS